MDGGEGESQPRNHLRAWREHRGLTQAQLAAVVGTEGSVISLLESGDRRLSDKWLRRLAPVLGTTPGFLLDYNPGQTSVALRDVIALIPKADRPHEVALLAREIAETEQAAKEPAPSKEKVVKLPKPKRNDIKAPRSRSTKPR